MQKINLCKHQRVIQRAREQLKKHLVLNMKNNNELMFLIEAIVSSEKYEGNFGYRVKDVSVVSVDIDKSLQHRVPSDYLEFVREFGYGELDAAFYLDDGLNKYSDICGRPIEGYEALYVFGGNSSDVLYAFDAKMIGGL
ncbi:SMI1/KNR4 family protein [Pseudomonas sp. KNUC1026]|uniref:SMI1/KNR4 family protein n=1 Tax=Pseudomonas sp. KNUC1026 TaxID=2893890 RepID=UPI001F448525|nr:SMI1/KNR4 family protein [Pseudomonas sp. KNUC1026]UFH49285.1 SMI1/KNR4 family protein [Pseudomonas sp. KNUC1026]